MTVRTHRHSPRAWAHLQVYYSITDAAGGPAGPPAASVILYLQRRRRPRAVRFRRAVAEPSRPKGPRCPSTPAVPRASRRFPRHENGAAPPAGAGAGTSSGRGSRMQRAAAQSPRPRTLTPPPLSVPRSLPRPSADEMRAVEHHLRRALPPHKPHADGGERRVVPIEGHPPRNQLHLRGCVATQGRQVRLERPNGARPRLADGHPIRHRLGRRGHKQLPVAGMGRRRPPGRGRRQRGRPAGHVEEPRPPAATAGAAGADAADAEVGGGHDRHGFARQARQLDDRVEAGGAPRGGHPAKRHAHRQAAVKKGERARPRVVQDANAVARPHLAPVHAGGGAAAEATARTVKEVGRRHLHVPVAEARWRRHADEQPVADKGR
ncbi:hypothetical protein BU14_0196s0013 [Porphyra umbilicalis]|uniref:Uncharacterized protein n=1 Tax=Porphyra umbilicalis TaxID=2786 RepID=A0A1X6P6G0_PORUM|nr:hypothetical protein BU14_0196s0013 [Porphyra umbilicalis]|eukprot:OSX76346.1 hypothetical protein BU14_0196s0013 [Porphyra umbilicalis]